MNSDLFTNIDYEDFFLHFKQHDAEMSVAAVPYNISIPYGILDLEGRNIQGITMPMPAFISLNEKPLTKFLKTRSLMPQT